MSDYFDFLREWAWPFDSGDREIEKEGSPFAFWSRERGYEAEGATLVFAFEANRLTLAPDAARPDRRLDLAPADVDALEAPIAAYLAGETSLDALIALGPAARALLAIHKEASDEAMAAQAAEGEAGGGDDGHS